jgi:hypothetical protein
MIVKDGTDMPRPKVHYGRVINGEIVLDDPNALPNGTEVTVRLLKRPPRKAAGGGRRKPNLYDRLKPVIGIIKDAPPDLAENHDHYIHGKPKRKR